MGGKDYFELALVLFELVSDSNFFLSTTVQIPSQSHLYIFLKHT